MQISIEDRWICQKYETVGTNIKKKKMNKF